MTHVFGIEAMATCEAKGCTTKWVQTWHTVGFEECTRCGRTGPVHDLTKELWGDTPAVLLAATSPSTEHVVAERKAWDPPYRWGSIKTCPADASPPFACDLPRPGGVVVWHEAPVSVAPPSPQPAAPRRPRYARTTPASREVEKLDTAPQRPWARTASSRAERDAEIRRRLALHEPTKSIAAMAGVTESRVRQIAKAAAISLRGSNQERDAEIRRRVAGGEPAAAVAEAFGLCEERIYQIAPRGRRTNHPAGSSLATTV